LKKNKTFIKGPRKKLKIKRMRIKLKNIIYDKLGLKDKIEKKIYKRAKNKQKKGLNLKYQ